MIASPLRSQGKLVQKLVHTLSRIIGVVMLAVMIGQPIAAIPAFAQETATISGVVLDAASNPISGATIILTGPTTVTTKSDTAGKYTASLPEGIYRILVRSAGYSDSTDDGVTVTADGLTLDVRLSRPTLSSLQTIGTVRSAGGSGGGPAFNPTAVAQSNIGAPTFENQGDVGVRDILDETPGIVDSSSNGSANGGVRGSITYPTIRGGLKYETASLIDGHPISVGAFGDYVTTFLNRYMFESIEVQKGPGSQPNQISRSVNGTVNFKTWDPTADLSGNAEFGVDGFGGKYGNIRLSDTVLNGKLGFVVDYAAEGTPGAAGVNNPSDFIAALSDVTYTNSAGVPVTVGGTTANRPPNAFNTTANSQTTSTIACCISMPTFYHNNSELAKLRFNFSDVTSFTATMLSSQTTSSQNGNVENLQNVNFDPSVPNATIASGHQLAFFPFNDNFAQDYEVNNEPFFSGELHTQLKNDNVSGRFYSASINRLQTNGDPTDTPFSVPVYLYGTDASGAPLNGTDPFGNPYTATITSPLFTTDEQDNLIGYTFEYDHSLGDTGNTISFAVDENYSWTHVYTPGEPDSSSTSNIPDGSAQNTGTYSLKGNFQIGSRLTATATYYMTRFDTHYPIFTGAANTISFNDNIFWHQDERIGLAYRLNQNTSLRFSAGSALVPPFLGILAGSAGVPALCTSSTCPAGIQPGTAAVSTQGGVNVVPETSFGYDLGEDWRLGSYMPDTVVSWDLYLTNLHNQFLNSTFLNGTAPLGAGGSAIPLYTTAFSNLSDARYEGIEGKIESAPPVGVGYAVQGALLRGYPYNIPASIYQFNAAGQATTNAGVISGVNFGPDSLLSSGGSAIPYAQGYVELNYHALPGWYASAGMIYYGPNNTFNEPAFEITRGTIRVPIHNKNNYVQLAVDNIFNINPEIFDIEGSGLTSPAINGQIITTNLKGYGPRNIHLVLVHNF
jgi:Carboxypeptidase regulatory-like domain/TonB-dependent Receptor Plug Domain